MMATDRRRVLPGADLPGRQRLGRVLLVEDEQDVAELIRYNLTKEGYDVVYARRLSRAGESRFKRATAHLFYRMLSRMSSVGIPADVGDFRLIDRKVLDALR